MRRTTATTSFILGGGLQALIAENGPLSLSTTLTGHYVIPYDVQGAGVSATNGAYTFFGEADGYEVSLGVLGAWTASPWKEKEVVVYAGPRVSAFRLSQATHYDYASATLDVWTTAEVKEESVWGFVLGTWCEVTDNLALRIQARLVQEASVSVGTSVSF